MQSVSGRRFRSVLQHLQISFFTGANVLDAEFGKHPIVGSLQIFDHQIVVRDRDLQETGVGKVFCANCQGNIHVVVNQVDEMGVVAGRIKYLVENIVVLMDTATIVRGDAISVFLVNLFKSTDDFRGNGKRNIQSGLALK